MELPSYPSTLRNRVFIANVLALFLPEKGHILETASGTGEHLHFFSEEFPSLYWQPSDKSSDLFWAICERSKNKKNIKGPISIDEIDQELLNSKQSKSDLFIRSLDKFPQLVDYIIPKNVRIADASRVRLGAYLSPGTTIMHEGFVNFNAGTLGTAMIEGRVSAGVVVGDNSDLGGGCSTMGTLSGGNNIKISIGENCLIGANAGVGIPLGDNCTIEAGLYITAGTKIELYKENGDLDGVFKGSKLSNCSNLVFLRNSQNGKVIAKVNQKSINLNSELHKND